MTQQALLTDKEAADYLNVSVSFLRKSRLGKHPRGPAFIRIGRLVRYRQKDLDAFIDGKVITSYDSLPNSLRQPSKVTRASAYIS